MDHVPVPIWLLLLLAMIAWAPARYVVRHVAQSPARRDITQPAADLRWRSSVRLAQNLAVLAVLLAAAFFLFTPAATAFAHSAAFLPLLIAGFGIFALWSVVRGYRSGVVEPMTRGTTWRFRRADQPRRYWASMTWNGLLAALFLVLSGRLIVDAPFQALRDLCEDWQENRPAPEQLAACNRLLAERPDENVSRLHAARGSAYYRLGDDRRAGAD